MIGQTIIIGVSGGSGSGKSTFAAALCEKLDGALCICSDRYFRKELPKMISPLDGKEYPDWNHPESIESEQMRQDILAACESGEYRYIVAEGAYVFCIEPLRALMDLKIWVDASIEMRIFRRIARNVVTKGQSVEFIGGYYLNCARYREREYSLPSAAFADIRVPNEAENEYRHSLDAVTDRISKISES